jgi:hypothetical protein
VKRTVAAAIFIHMDNPMNTLMAVTLILILVLILTIAGTVAKARRDARHWQLMASAERELGTARSDISRSAGITDTRRPKTIGGRK